MVLAGLLLQVGFLTILTKLLIHFFILVESIESYLQINSGKPVEKLSAEHITACSTNGLQCGGGGGCEGSVTQLGFIYAQLFGLVTEQDYPYLSGNVS